MGVPVIKFCETTGEISSFLCRVASCLEHFLCSQLRVIRKQENGQPPRFLGNFVDFRVSPPLSFLGDQQTGREERPSFLETRANTPQSSVPQFLLKDHQILPLNFLTRVFLFTRSWLYVINTTGTPL